MQPVVMRRVSLMDGGWRIVVSSGYSHLGLMIVANRFVTER